MRKELQFFLRHHPIALALFLLGLATALFLSARFAYKLHYFNDPAHINQQLEPWMTPRYVAMSYKLPPERVRALMKLQKSDGKSYTLAQVTEKLGISLPQLQILVEQEAAAHRLSRSSDSTPGEANGG